MRWAEASCQSALDSSAPSAFVELIVRWRRVEALVSLSEVSVRRQQHIGLLQKTQEELLQKKARLRASLAPSGACASGVWVCPCLERSVRGKGACPGSACVQPCARIIFICGLLGFCLMQWLDAMA